MFGTSPAGTGAFGTPQDPWRGFVEATVNALQSGDVVPVGSAKALSSVDATADGALVPVAVAVSAALVDATAANDTAVLTVSIAPAVATIAQSGDVVALSVSVIESTGTITQDGAITPLAVAIGTSGPDIAQSADVLAAASAIAMGTGNLVQSVEVSGLTAAGETVAAYVPSPPAMLPLVESHEADELESELKALFIALFEANIRPDERFMNVLGMPHHGPRELIEQSLAADGLSIYRGADVASGAGAYLLRAWRAMNPKRGKHLLETYLQLLWPNVWKADQMWQATAGTYPNALVTADGGAHFLTSRVNVSLPARVTTGGDLNAIQAGLRASMPARMVMNLAIVDESSFGIGMAAVYYAGTVAQSYEGTFT